MILILWGLLNLFLMLAFLFFALGLILRGRKFFEGYNLKHVFLVLFIGISGFLLMPKSKKTEARIIYGKMEVIRIEENLTNSIFLNLVRDKDTGEILQEETNSTMSGFVAGIDWHHLGVSEKDEKLILEGFITWRLLGWRVLDSFHSYEVPDFNLPIE
ncbi:hypothetical protein DFQ04_0216 [Algoriphagus boseongensis]|uniref:Uncharacterized protein n=1 Tax=Algoriphagus boseongensis TaxID=1442587 RepID=A0A4V3D2D0_9BACT|nr:hypothetical protein [Algoriphagus boseongensis]TDQ18417.1 hypothetical protein DFQ04_0216 [Algoriphagus boseongensis]